LQGPTQLLKLLMDQLQHLNSHKLNKSQLYLLRSISDAFPFSFVVAVYEDTCQDLLVCLFSVQAQPESQKNRVVSQHRLLLFCLRL